jgi:hypothetical protein
VGGECAWGFMAFGFGFGFGFALCSLLLLLSRELRGAAAMLLVVCVFACDSSKLAILQSPLKKPGALAY